MSVLQLKRGETGFLREICKKKLTPTCARCMTVCMTFWAWRQPKIYGARHYRSSSLGLYAGRTLDDSFIILDEAQNTTPEQMKMFLTRIGCGSKAVITGDVTQIDLPKGECSGLIQAEEILNDIDGIVFEYLDQRDVVRHPLVQKIIKAYEDYRINNGAREGENSG